ncbi:ABC transporter substrate-binding protein [Acuticoccus yangtzensis]|uniref:ABC transporter substrate-binding protein n=1 Tax=Acuticoccus yangtzensis TaxID=1443441 RepID=UPI00094972E1|nr:ABC transporter substrate-binding protein [Acuticoccus yangtzensis]ORE91330.1 ABC transporter, substrate-binding component [Stappia sp. 22II-S9-Z10]
MNKLLGTIAAGTIASLSVAGTANAQATLTVGGYGGSFETLMKEIVFPAFEAEHDVTVEFVAGNSTENLARLVAQRGNQDLDVVILDDGPMYQADALGFCAPLADGVINEDVYDNAKISDNAVGLGYVATGFTYNTEWFEREGWEPPSSWNDLTDPKFEGLLVVPPISNTYGLHALVMMARMKGGGENDIDPGFEAMADEVGPNVLVFEPSSGRMSELFQSNEIALSIWGSGRTKSLADTGFPAAFAYPKEGAVALMLAACPVVESDVPEEAQAFMEFMLTPEIQVKIADAMGVGPVNAKAEIPEELAAIVPYGPEEVAALVSVDWDVINPLREEWTQRWAREVER